MCGRSRPAPTAAGMERMTDTARLTGMARLTGVERKGNRNERREPTASAASQRGTSELRGPRRNTELAERFRGVQVCSEHGGERMSMDSYSNSATYPGGHSSAARVGLVLLGIAAIVLGVVLLFRPVAAARSLALLIALALLLAGMIEMTSPHFRQRWVPIVLGALLIIGGILAVVWPGITLWVLAVIVGLDLLLHGFVRIAIAVFDREEPHAVWTLAVGLLNIAVGLMALVWPGATVVVLALLLA